MKIAVDISQIVYSGTGVANYTVNLIKKIVELDRKNDYVLFGISLRQTGVFENFYDEIQKINDKVTKKFLPIPQTLGNFLWNRLHRIPVEKFIGKIDVFHSSDWIQPPTFAKKITTIHDMIVYRFPETSHPEIISTQKRRMGWVKKECDIILTDSHASKKDIEDILKINPERIEVVYPGIGEEFKNASEEETFRIRQKYGLSGLYLLTVGTMEPRKNLKRIIQAFEIFSRHPLVQSQRSTVDLVLVGKSGWDDTEIKSEKVKTLGFVQEGDLPGLYSGASMFLYPSLYEGFGLPVLEAMACGCPVISSHRGSLKEVVSDSGLVVDPLDAEDIAVKMVQLFVDKDLRLKLIKKGQEHATQFTWQNAATKVLSCYKKLV